MPQYILYQVSNLCITCTGRVERGGRNGCHNTLYMVSNVCITCLGRVGRGSRNGCHNTMGKSFQD